MGSYAAIVIGVSAGGLHALSAIISVLEADFPLPIAVVQHLAPDSDSFLATYLNRAGALRVKEADEKEPMTPGTVYIAPPNFHLLIERDRTLSLSIDPPVNYARPAIDLLFESAAEAYGPALIGVVLTGANRDGAAGLRRIEDLGGMAVVQDPSTAESSAMPLAAAAETRSPRILPLGEIGPFLMRTSRL